MRVIPGHRRGRVAQDVTPHRFSHAALCRPCAPGVPQIMKSEVADVGVFTSPPKSVLDVLQMRACPRVAEDISLRGHVNAKTLEDLPNFSTERNTARFAVLGLLDE